MFGSAQDLGTGELKSAQPRRDLSVELASQQRQATTPGNNARLRTRVRYLRSLYGSRWQVSRACVGEDNGTVVAMEEGHEPTRPPVSFPSEVL